MRLEARNRTAMYVSESTMALMVRSTDLSGKSSLFSNCGRYDIRCSEDSFNKSVYLFSDFPPMMGYAGRG